MDSFQGVRSHLRYHSFFLSIFRRHESVFVQGRLGSIGPELTEGFERSALSSIVSGGGTEWWKRTKPVFTASFVAYVDKRLAPERLPSLHPAPRGPNDARGAPPDKSLRS